MWSCNVHQCEVTGRFSICDFYQFSNWHFFLLFFQAYFRQGVALQYLGRHADALAAFASGLAQDPKSLQLLVGMVEAAMKSPMRGKRQEIFSGDLLPWYLKAVVSVYGNSASILGGEIWRPEGNDFRIWLFCWEIELKVGGGNKKKNSIVIQWDGKMVTPHSRSTGEMNQTGIV